MEIKIKKKTNLQPTWRKWYITNRLQNHHAYFNKLSVGESNSNLIKWLIDSILLYVPLEYFTLIWRRHNCQWRTAEFRPLFGSSSGIFFLLWHRASVFPVSYEGLNHLCVQYDKQRVLRTFSYSNPNGNMIRWRSRVRQKSNEGTKRDDNDLMCYSLFIDVLHSRAM